MQLAGRERLQDQQVERPLQQIQLTLTRIRSHVVAPSYRHSARRRYAASYRMSIGRDASEDRDDQPR